MKIQPRIGVALALTTLVVPFVAPIASAQTKPTFVSKKHGFSIYLPQKPTASTRPKPAMLGRGTIEVFTTPPAPVSYSIVPLTLPASAANISRKVYFDSVQQGILQSSGGKAVGSRDLKVNGQAVRAFGWSFSAPTKTSKSPVAFAGETRIYKLGARTYQFTALVPKGQLAASRAQIGKVLGSVTIAK